MFGEIFHFLGQSRWKGGRRESDNIGGGGGGGEKEDKEELLALVFPSLSLSFFLSIHFCDKLTILSHTASKPKRGIRHHFPEKSICHLITSPASKGGKYSRPTLRFPGKKPAIMIWEEGHVRVISQKIGAICEKIKKVSFFSGERRGGVR